MLTVGLTGGIGAGKSAVSELLASHGATVVDADLIAREVVAPGSAGLAAVVAAFGTQVLDAAGALDRPRLGERVFGDEAARLRLNAIVHPLIGARTVERMAAAQAADPAGVLVHDVPLLVEAALGPGYHLVVVVDAPVPVRLERLAARGLPAEQAQARMAAQADHRARVAAADVLLDNGTSRRALGEQVQSLWSGRLRPYAAHLAAGTVPDRGPVCIAAPDPAWAAQGTRLVARLRHLAPDAVRIDHVGSTAVPGLPAKDVLDLQIEVATWAQVEALAGPLADAGFLRRPDVDGDPVRARIDPEPAQWRKRLHRSADPGRPANVHVRVAGTAAAELARRFRDRLRSDSDARERYAALKQRLADLHRRDVEAYAEGKTDFILAVVQGSGEFGHPSAG